MLWLDPSITGITVKPMKQIVATVENLPRPAPAPGALLNSPAQSEGSFVIGWDKPITQQDWPVLSKFMWKYSRDDLEEFDMFYSEPGWRINEPGLVEAHNRGYEIVLDGVKIDFTSGMSIGDQVMANRKAEQERRLQEAKRRAAEEAARKNKADSWLVGKSPIKIDWADVTFETLDEVVFFSNSAGSRFTKLVKFTSPAEIAGLEGAWVADHNWDTHYDTFHVPSDIAKVFNAPIVEKELANKRAATLATPETHEMEHAMNVARGASIEITWCTCGAEHVKFIEENADTIIKTWQENMRKFALTGSMRTRWSTISRWFTGNLLSNDEACIASILGMKDELEATWEITKNEAVEKANEEAARKEAARKAENERARVEREARESERKVKIAQVAATIAGTKQELLVKYAGAGLKKSWTKEMMIEVIARSIVDGRVVDKKRGNAEKEMPDGLDF